MISNQVDLWAIIRLTLALVLFWVGIYLVSRNIRSKLAWVLFTFLFSLSAYVTFIDVIGTIYADNFRMSVLLEAASEWTYILPIPVLLHLSILTTHNSEKLNKYSLVAIYVIALLLILLGISTDLLVSKTLVLHYNPNYGYFMARGIFFPVISIIAVWASVLAARNYLKSFAVSKTLKVKYKFGLAAVGALIYILIGPFLVYIYSSTSNYDFAVYSTAPILVSPVLFWLISIFFFRLVSDVEDIFNFKEFTYLTGAMIIIIAIFGSAFIGFSLILGKSSLLFISIFLYVIILTHAFYDWLTTFIRDLLYNAGKGFSIITDTDVNDLVHSFYIPEKIETGALVRFKSVKNRAQNGQFVDSAQSLVREAVEYFKQDDYPRRTKQNLKYQILKMMIFDEADEGQILWELGFEGYPMKIMSGEDQTRKPLFKIESMSDYTAVSRNAFISLKKEAIHDLTWRLSYLEKTSK